MIELAERAVEAIRAHTKPALERQLEGLDSLEQARVRADSDRYYAELFAVLEPVLRPAQDLVEGLAARTTRWRDEWPQYGDGRATAIHRQLERDALEFAEKTIARLEAGA